MKLLLKSSLLSVLVIVFFSCDKDGGNTPLNTTGLNISIDSPSNNSTFIVGDLIMIAFTVTDDIDITTIAWSTKGEFGTGSVPAEELAGEVTKYSGEFFIAATVEPGTYPIEIAATDEEFTNVATEVLTVIIQ